ncbi:MAG: Na/Pi cotransporter family protein [Candidatus Cryptobacteroides sp.]
MQIFIQILTLLGAVTLFLFGLSLLSGGLQKVAGDGLRSFLASMTSNPFKRIVTGVGVTAVIQSSTATTIMVVSFVNAGLLTLAQAIGVIMGANIGTTVTSWIMAVFGFSYDISTISFPLIALGFLMMQSRKNQKIKDLGEIIIGFALFFIGFAKLKATASVLLDGIDLSVLQAWTDIHLGPLNVSVLLFLLLGTILTICFQSSAATMAIIMLLITTGVIPFKMAAAMILGENIGTTIAANIAASVGNTASKRAAMAHTVFNVFGVVWVLCVFPWFLSLIGKLVSSFGLYDPNYADLTDAANADRVAASLLYSVTTMHTLFNITNTLILIWFIPQIEKVVSWIIPSKGEEEVYRLKYIAGGPLSTAELSLDEAKQEIIHFATICRKGFRYVRNAITETDNDKFAEEREKLIKYEGITDRIEYEIASYLNEVSKGEISEKSSLRIKGMYKIIGELESLGDSGEAIGRMVQRRIDHGKSFSEEQLKKLGRMMDLVDAAYDVMIRNLSTPYYDLKDISNAQDAEYNINECRNNLREEHILNIEENPQYNYQTGVFYMDIVAELEKMGDFMINISEAQISENAYA